MMLHPSILPEDNDPEGSTRYSCLIIHIINGINSTKTEHTNYIDLISEKGIFIVIEDRYGKSQIKQHDGVVLREADNSYSWWFNLV